MSGYLGVLDFEKGRTNIKNAKVTKTTKRKSIQQSPHKTLIQQSVLATPNVTKMNKLTTNEVKRSNEPTPHFIPNSEGRFPRGIANILQKTTTPKKGKKNILQEIPEMTNKAIRPKRVPSESPERVIKDPEPVSSRTRSASITPRRQNESYPIERKSRARTRETPENQSTSKELVPVIRRSASLMEQPPEPTLTITELPSDYNTFKAPQIIRARGISVPAKKPATVLANWFIKFLPEMLNKSGSYPPFILVGVNVSSGVVNDANQSWHTTIITEVREGNTPEECSFFTVRGSEYKTSGKISIKHMNSQHQWFTKELISKFALGFPCDWMPQLWAAFERFQENRKSNLSTSLNPINNEAIDMAADEFEVAKPPERIRSISVDNGGLNETITKSERIVRRPSEVAISMPLLNVERGGSQRVIAKKRTVNYSSSDSDDNQAVINTLKAIKYDKNRHEPRPKKIKLSDWNYEADTMRRVYRKRMKLCKEIQELDKMMNHLISNMQKKAAANQKISLMHEEEAKSTKILSGLHKEIRRSSRKELSESSDEESSSSESDSENDGKSSSSDSGELDDWKFKISKKTSRKVGRKVTKKSRKAPSNKARKAQILTDSEEEMIEEPKKVKRATWRQYDLEKLKRILSLQKVRNDDDWKQIADALGAEFTPEDCKSVAMKKFNWKQPVENTKEAKESIVITAKQGTQAYKIQSDEQCRKYMLGAGSYEDDFFRQLAPEEDDEELIIDGELDDSILEVLKTPTLSDRKKKGNNRGEPCFPADFDDEDTPRLSNCHSFDEPSALERENHQRYLHQITNNRSNLNVTRANSTQNTTMMDRSQVLNYLGRNIEKITKKLKKQMPKKKISSDFEDEDDDLM